MSANKKQKVLRSWLLCWDLQCPYAKVNWQKLPAIRERFDLEFDFEIVLTSLAFHPQAFTGQCAATLVKLKKGEDARRKFIDACYSNQDRYMDKTLGDARPSEVDKIFAGIVQEAGLFDDSFDEKDFLANLHDWELVVKPTYAEHEVALGYKVFGTPKSVIDQQLITDTESSWGPDEWAEKLLSIEYAAFDMSTWRAS
jgi:hypothetical protein